MSIIKAITLRWSFLIYSLLCHVLRESLKQLQLRPLLDFAKKQKMWKLEREKVLPSGLLSAFSFLFTSCFLLPVWILIPKQHLFTQQQKWIPVITVVSSWQSLQLPHPCSLELCLDSERLLFKPLGFSQFQSFLLCSQLLPVIHCCFGNMLVFSV